MTHKIKHMEEYARMGYKVVSMSELDPGVKAETERDVVVASVFEQISVATIAGVLVTAILAALGMLK